MSSIYQKRAAADLGTSITKFSASEWDPETRVVYFIGLKSAVHHKYKDDPGWKSFLERTGLNDDMPVEELSKRAALDTAEKICSDDFIHQITESIIEQARNNPERNFDKVRISFPFPLDESATLNNFAPALAAAITNKIEQNLPAELKEQGLQNLEVIADLDPVKSSKDQAILNIVNNQRGKTSIPNQGEEVATYMQRVSRQAVYSGEVDPNAIYVPVDDFLVSQSTAAGLLSYIKSNGGVSTPVVTGFKLFNGTEILAPQQETLDLLETAISSKGHEVKAVGGEAAFKEKLNNTLERAGLKIDFDNVSNTTLSNIELLFIAGYFSDGENIDHQEAFEAAVTAIGADIEEVKGNSSHDVFNSPPGNLSGLEKVFEKVLESREMMATQDSSRYQDLVENDKITNFKGGNERF